MAMAEIREMGSEDDVVMNSDVESSSMLVSECRGA